MIPGIETSLRFLPFDGESASSFAVRLVRFVSPAWEKALRDFVNSDDAVGSVIHRIAIAADIAALAGVDISVVRAGMAIPDPNSGSSIHFGPFILNYDQISQLRRRIAPQVFANDISRKREPFHRSVWTIKALCADPETGELIIQDCPACGAALLWANITEVGRCGSCAQKLWLSPAKTPTGIDRELSSFYGELFHPDEKRRAALRQHLPGELAEWNEAAILEFVDSLATVFSLTPKSVSTVNSSDPNVRINGVRAILGGARVIEESLARPLREAHISSDRLANTITVAQILAIIDRNRSPNVRKYLKNTLAECAL